MYLERKGSLVLFGVIVLLLQMFTVLQVSAQETLPRDETLYLTETSEFTIFDSFNPFIPNGVQWSQGFNGFLKEDLWYINYATGEWIWWLATGYEYSEDVKTFTISLRHGVEWNDGEPFTSKDIAFTINMLKENAPKLYWSAYYDEWVDSVETPDDYTAILHLKKPNPMMHIDIRGAWDGGFWVPEHVWKDQDPMTFKNNPPVLTGPYKIYKTFPDLMQFIYVRNEEYWAKDISMPEPKYIVMKTSSAADVEAVEIIQNLIDHAHRVTYSCPLLVSLTGANPNITLAPFWDPCPRGIRINCAKYPLSLPEVRWAISYCVNREKLAETIWAPFETVPAKWPWSMWASVVNDVFLPPDVLEAYDLTYDPAKAAEILDTLGFTKGADGIRVTPNGTRLSWEIMTPSYVGGPEYTVAFDLAQELTKIGVEAKATTQPWAVLDEKTTTGVADMTSQWLCGCWHDPRETYSGFHSKYIAPIGERQIAGNWERLESSELDTVIDELGVLTPDNPDAVPLYKEGLELYLKLLPQIPVVQTIYVMDFLNTYWTHWPTEADMYEIPFSWWDNFKWTVHSIKKVTPIEYVGVWIMEVVTAFVGVDKKTYGPFAVGAYATVPKEDATRLIGEGLASYTPPPAQTVTVTSWSTTTTTTSVSVPTMDITSVAGASIVTLIVGVVVGWLVASRRK